jgi:type III pantothenate kinase
VVDFGTATTFDVLDAADSYLGGVIAPGIGLSRDILNERTAKLPKIDVFRPARVIGRNTVDAMASGLICAYECMVEGMLIRIEKELESSVELLLTGGYAETVKISRRHRVVKNLCFEGLKQLCRQVG